MGYTEGATLTGVTTEWGSTNGVRLKASRTGDFAGHRRRKRLQSCVRCVRHRFPLSPYHLSVRARVSPNRITFPLSPPLLSPLLLSPLSPRRFLTPLISPLCICHDVLYTLRMPRRRRGMSLRSSSKKGIGGRGRPGGALGCSRTTTSY